MATKQKYLMFVSYVGSGFWGSQLQTVRNGSEFLETVQYVLENGLKYIYRLRGERPIPVRPASRTDRGVHALKAALVVDLPPFRRSFLTPGEILHRLNDYFEDLRNVRVLEVCSVPDSFSFSSAVLDKTYLYRIGVPKPEFFNEFKNNVIPIMEVERTHFCGQEVEFDLSMVKKATQLFEGKKDFRSIVCNKNTVGLPTVCNIMSFTVEEAPPLVPFDLLSQRYNYYHFICRGDRFLNHMVRRMVSISISVGFNLLSLNDVQRLFDEPASSSWPKQGYTSVKGCGLYLVDVNIDREKIKS